MLLAFFIGFLTAVACVVGGVVYAFKKLNSTISAGIVQAATERTDLKREIDAAASLDPVKIISKVQFGTFDAVAVVPPDAEDRLERNFTRAAGRHVRYGRITLVGAVISVYETVVVDRSGTQKPLKEKLKKENKRDASSGTVNSVVGLLSGDLRAGEPASERLVGKIPISRLNVRVESLSDSPYPVSGTASVHTRYLVLQREGTDVPGQVYTFPPTLDGSDDVDAPRWLAEQDPNDVLALTSPQLFSLNGARPDTKRGVMTHNGKEYATFAHHDDTPIRWRTLMIRFSTVRELERWYDVLRPSIVTNQWKVFLKSLPQVDVLNVLMSRIFFENRELKELNYLVTQKINKSLTKVVFPPTMMKSRVVAHEVNVGGEIPIISNVSPLATSACGEIAFDMDVWYRGGFTCKLLVDLWLNTDRVLKLDFKAPSVEATVHLKELKGRVHLSIGAPPSHGMWLGFHELPEVVVELNLELVKNENTGTLARLVMNAIPDLSEILTNVVREKLFEDMTLPHLDDFPVPNVEKTPPTTPRSTVPGGVGVLDEATAEPPSLAEAVLHLSPADAKSAGPRHSHTREERDFVHVSAEDAKAAGLPNGSGMRRRL